MRSRVYLQRLPLKPTMDSDENSKEGGHHLGVLNTIGEFTSTPLHLLHLYDLCMKLPTSEATEHGLSRRAANHGELDGPSGQPTTGPAADSGRVQWCGRRLAATRCGLR
eukprot:m.234213 g.234213  ORF g.234213 m.234213 type:complete len:109 (-) comp26117_c0_seq1:463-789(-)